MDKSPLVKHLKDLCYKDHVEIASVINKDGDVQASVGNIEPIQLETFGIMAATIFGAALTANEQLRKNKPSKIMVDAPDGETIIRGVGKNNLLVVRAKKNGDTNYILEEMNETSKKILNHLK